jgi:hypothetical protein
MSKRRRKPSMPRVYTNEMHVAQLTQHLNRRGPTDEYASPTPERVKLAKAAGERIIAELLLTEGGNPTGHYKWRITPVIDELRRRGTITVDEHHAAERFMLNWQLGIHRGPATSSYTPRTDGGSPDGDAEVIRWEHGNRAKAALLAVDGFLRPALAWLIASLGDPRPLKDLGAYYSPDKGDQTKSSQGAIVLRLALASLCRHYNIDHSFNDKRMANLSRILLSKMGKA